MKPLRRRAPVPFLRGTYLGIIIGISASRAGPALEGITFGVALVVGFAIMGLELRDVRRRAGSRSDGV